MNNPPTVLSKLRERWLLASASFLVVTIACLCVLSAISGVVIWPATLQGSLVLLRRVASLSEDHANEADARRAKGAALQDPEQAAPSDRRKELVDQIAREQQEREDLVKKRRHTSYLIGKSGLQTADGTNEGKQADYQNPREQLRAALIGLILLEKRYPEDNPEIRNLREEITQLQKQVAQAPADASPTTSHSAGDRPDYESQLASTKSAIAVVDVQLAADMRELAAVQASARPAKVGPSAKILDHQQRASQSDTATMQSTQTAPVESISVGGTWRQAYGLDLAVLLMSLASGISAAMVVVLLSDWRHDTIRDEVDLGKLLPGGVDCIGTVPRMRQS